MQVFAATATDIMDHYVDGDERQIEESHSRRRGSRAAKPATTSGKSRFPFPMKVRAARTAAYFQQLPRINTWRRRRESGRRIEGDVKTLSGPVTAATGDASFR